MKVELKPDFEIGDTMCEASTGKTLTEWISVIESKPELAGKRRNAIEFLYRENGVDAWWATTIWVEYEKKNEIVQKDGRAEGYNICVTKTVVAPLESVFDAWVNPAKLGWLGDGIAVQDDKSLLDPIGHKAQALRVRENKDLRYKWHTHGIEHESQADVSFALDAKGRVGVMVNHARIQSRDEADGLRRAWGEALTRLKAQLEG